MRDYAAIFEKTSTGWSAYCPDLPEPGVAGQTYEATDGDPIPKATTRVTRMPISA